MKNEEWKGGQDEEYGMEKIDWMKNEECKEEQDEE
jgi:hypothetical protein